jgi:von Willebrand factor type A domain
MANLRLPELSRRTGIPLADSGRLARAIRRTTFVRLGLLAVLVGLAALAVWRAAGLETRTVSFLPESSTTIVVLDQSRSVYLADYKEIAAVLTRVVQGDPSVGLVAFSDTAYEMLPPGSHGSDLKALLRFYRPTGAGANVDPTTNFPASPWDNTFSGGTKISSGLQLAREMVERDHVKHATILLVSDLETAGEDRPAFAESLIRIRNDPRLSLRIAPLYAIPEERAFVARFVPRDAFVHPSQIRGHGPAEPRRRLLAHTPWALIIAGALILLTLAVNELLCGRLDLRRRREGLA